MADEAAAPGQSSNMGPIVPGIVIPVLIVAIGGALLGNCLLIRRKEQKEDQKEKQKTVSNTAPIDNSETFSPYDRNSNCTSAANRVWPHHHSATQATHWADSADSPPAYAATARYVPAGVNGIPNDEFISSPYNNDRKVASGRDT